VFLLFTGLASFFLPLMCHQDGVLEVECVVKIIVINDDAEARQGSGQTTSLRLLATC